MPLTDPYGVRGGELAGEYIHRAERYLSDHRQSVKRVAWWIIGSLSLLALGSGSRIAAAYI